MDVAALVIGIWMAAFSLSCLVMAVLMIRSDEDD